MCEQQGLRPVLVMLPSIYPRFIALSGISAGAVGRGHAVTVGSDHILITEAVRNIHS